MINEQNLPSNQVPLAEPDPAPQEVAPPPVPPPARPKISDLAKEVFKKFYENKKIFRLVIITFSILLLVVISGLIFSASKNGGEIKMFSSPTPEVTSLPGKESEDENVIKLKDLKEKTINLDLHQKRLSPPSINFNISF